MATIRNPSMDAVPLLNVGSWSFTRLPTLQEVAQFLRRASGRRMTMREPTLLARGSAGATRNDWTYSRLAALLDVLWNLSFVLVAAGVLITSFHESPETPLRLWVVVYALQCVLHLVCVSVVKRKRGMVVRAQMGVGVGVGEGNVERGSRGSSESRSSRLMRDIEEGVHSRGNDRGEENQSIPKNWESASTAFSFIWWIIGFYWVSTGAKTLNHVAPQLFRLCIIFLAFDVFFILFCVSLACAIGLLVCCCFPCITTILYTVPDKEGASDEEIRQLPKYIFRKVDDSERFASEISERCGGIMTECDSDLPKELVVRPEDVECCICMSPYEDGAELRGLPCNHHFHLDCIEKWLQINATCPLCKFSIIESSNHGREEV